LIVDMVDPVPFIILLYGVFTRGVYEFMRLIMLGKRRFPQACGWLLLGRLKNLYLAPMASR
jgi:hypothetical protein